MTVRMMFLLISGALYALAPEAGELRFALRLDPKTLDPLLASEEASETIRYLTSGVLIRIDRRTQQPLPELAESWAVRDSGKRIDFVLRKNIRFSDGSPFSAEDVVATVRRVMDPGLHSAIADAIRGSVGEVKAQANGMHYVSVSFSTPAAGLELLFDQLAISPAKPAAPQSAVLGPFRVAEYKGGQYILLRRNPYYWKTDKNGTKLPYLGSIRLDIQSSRETELLRFRRGELHFVDKLDPEAFERLRKERPSEAISLGASFDNEFVWFNQTPGAPIPAHRAKWFASRPFRRAISAAINRSDMVRLVYKGYAHPAVGPISSSNRFWFNSSLRAQPNDVPAALRLLQQDGFNFDGRDLRDREGRPVEFSLITNANSRIRPQLATMLQEDLRKIGIRVNVVPLEFQSLIERIMQTQQYEACLLGLSNVDLDPNGQMNVWLSSSALHAWNPRQKTPATPWEAEIDRLMKTQATSLDANARKRAFDRVQEIVAEQAPIIYLVNPDALVAVSRRVRNAAPSVLPPHLYWNIEQLSLATPDPRRGQ